MIVRPALAADADGMTNVLNPIIAEGGTTAHRTLFTPDRMVTHYIENPLSIATHVAEIDGRIAGFQTLKLPDPEHPDALPEGWAVIASFVDSGFAGKGVGTALFEATMDAARAVGITHIDATIRADNASGLGYYGALGFIDYDRLTGVPLSDGTPVDRIRKRFDL